MQESLQYYEVNLIDIFFLEEMEWSDRANLEWLALPHLLQLDSRTQIGLTQGREGGQGWWEQYGGW